ncbi:MAG: hypothetical protein L0210_06900 [Rhodospirillales bacterium]|nr:hypothetical protein [Rhodospirillales bacterium]
MIGAWLALAGAGAAETKLVPLVEVGPWSAVSGLVGFGERLWFVNSEKYVNHNSADVWSYDPRSGTTRYERHLFSQDAGNPLVEGGRLYWPFEDARFDSGWGEFMVTDGVRWQWRVIPNGQVFHVHAMAAIGTTIYAATSAWQASLQSSDDSALTWRQVYVQPTPERVVSRGSNLAVVDEQLLWPIDIGSGASGQHILLLTMGDNLRRLDSWPDDVPVTAHASYNGWFYAAVDAKSGDDLWRTDGQKVQRLRSALDGKSVRAMAAGAGLLWAVTAERSGGTLWRSADGADWQVTQELPGYEPHAVTVYGGQVYVGTTGPQRRGFLWGPRAPAPVEVAPSLAPLPAEQAVPPGDASPNFDILDRALLDPDSYRNHGERLRDILYALAVSRPAGLGEELSKRLDGPFPKLVVPTFGGSMTATATDIARTHLLWAMAVARVGHVPTALLLAPWTAPPNRPEKYFKPQPFAIWTAAALGQNERPTIEALISRLEQPTDPDWLQGDVVGALTALTGERFAYDVEAWRRWWAATGQVAH